MSSIDVTPVMNDFVSAVAEPRRRTARGFSRRRLDYSRNIDRFLQPFLLVEVQTFLHQWGFKDNGSYDALSDLVAFDALRRLLSESELKEIVNYFVTERKTPYGCMFSHTIKVCPAFQLLFVRRVSTGTRETFEGHQFDNLKGLLPTDAVALCGTPIKHPLFDDFPMEIIPFAQLSRMPTESNDTEIAKQHLSTLSNQSSGIARYQKVLQILAPVLALSSTVDASDYNNCIHQSGTASHPETINVETQRPSSSSETVGAKSDSINHNEANQTETVRYLSVNVETQRPVSNDDSSHGESTFVHRRRINISTRYTPHDLNSHRREFVRNTAQSTSTPLRSESLVQPNRASASHVPDSDSTPQADQRRVRHDRSRNLVRQIQSELCELTAMQNLAAIKELYDFTKMLKQTLERSTMFH